MLAPPPPQICKATDLAPLRHALAQIDGASLIDEGGSCGRSASGSSRPPKRKPRSTVSRGTRHTSGLRYSADDPNATVIVVSEDGPVTVMRAGRMIGASTAPAIDHADLDAT